MDDTLKILILEDNDNDAVLLEHELAKADITYQSRVAATMEDYVRALRQFGPDLILADFAMPQFDGNEAMKLAQRHCPQAQFIVVSGVVIDDHVKPLLMGGAVDVLLKDKLHRVRNAVHVALNKKIQSAAILERLKVVEVDVKATAQQLGSLTEQITRLVVVIQGTLDRPLEQGMVAQVMAHGEDIKRLKADLAGIRNSAWIAIWGAIASAVGFILTKILNIPIRLG